MIDMTYAHRVRRFHLRPIRFRMSDIQPDPLRARSAKEIRRAGKLRRARRVEDDVGEREILFVFSFRWRACFGTRVTADAIFVEVRSVEMRPDDPRQSASRIGATLFHLAARLEELQRLIVSRHCRRRRDARRAVTRMRSDYTLERLN